MKLFKIGLIREGKTPYDKRVALTPNQCKLLLDKYSNISFYCQPSSFRSYADSEYINVGIPVQEDITHCDILFGIKEIPVDQLLPGKTYFFFSHTLKKQPYNRKLLQEILKRKITLIDYEAIIDEKGERLVAFGKYAGIVGTYNAFRTIGLKYKTSNLPPAHTLFDKAELLGRLKQCLIPPIKIVVTGSGRVAKGAKEILDELNVLQVSPEDFLTKSYPQAVYTMPRSSDYYEMAGGNYDQNLFYSSPQNFKSTFLRFADQADILIACAYWNPSAPKLFTKEEMRSPNFKIKIIADITCDIHGSIPSTLRPSTIYDPFYDYNPYTEEIEVSFSSDKNITVMAIDNLPTELPRDASEFFGLQLMEHVFPALIEGYKEEVLARSIIATDGHLTSKFSYLQEFISEATEE